MSDRSSVSGSQGAAHHFALAKGTRLFEFEIGPVLGHGGFGITYRAVDTLLQEDVAIKEFLPNELAVRVSDETVKAKSAGDQDSFRTGLSTFLEEARMIARFRHPNIMQVRRFFELHGTGYIVLEYERGRTLSQRLADGPIGEAELRDLLLRLLDGLEAVHDRGILHRDLKPSNIIIRDNGTPVLIDFGAARDFTSRHSRSITAIAAPGYSPPEQYGVGGQQGPWTDFYALGAILYRCVTGSAPVDSLRRLRKDPLVPATVAAAGKYDAGLLGIIDWMVEVDEANRPESAAQIRAALAAGHAPSGHAPSAPSGAVAAETVSAAPTSVEVTKGAGGAAILGFSKESRADILDLAVHATPPGRYLTRAGTGQTSWSSEPHYLSLERAGPEAGRAAYVLDATLVAAIPPGARVEISSSDNFIRTGTDWPHWAVPAVPPRSPNRMLTIAAVLVGLAIVVVVAAMNLGALGDVACARLGLCSADRVALAQVQSCVAAARPCEARSCAATFKSQFAGSALMVRVAAIDDQAERRCRASEDTEFERANRCAEPKMMAVPVVPKRARDSRIGGPAGRQDAGVRWREIDLQRSARRQMRRAPVVGQGDGQLRAVGPLQGEMNQHALEHLSRDLRHHDVARAIIGRTEPHALGSDETYFDAFRDGMQAQRDQLCDGLAALGFEVFVPEGTYFATTDIRPLGFVDGLEFCRRLPELAGVVAIPHQVFHDDVEAGRPLVRWAFCKRPDVIAEALRRLRRLRPDEVSNTGTTGSTSK